jgi:hypothetical protein
MAGNGKIQLESLPPELQKQVTKALGVEMPKRHHRKAPAPVMRAEILQASALVMAALHKSKLPSSSWYRVLGQCQRWTRNPGRV